MRALRVGLLLTVTMVLVAAAPAGAEKDEAGFVRITPDQIAWKDMPGYEGVKFAVIEGDPKKEGSTSSA